MQEFVKDRLPKFTLEESKLLKNSFDFIGLNYYSGAYAQDASTKPMNGDLDYNTDPMVTVTGKLLMVTNYIYTSTVSLFCRPFIYEPCF